MLGMLLLHLLVADEALIHLAPSSFGTVRTSRLDVLAKRENKC